MGNTCTKQIERDQYQAQIGLSTFIQIDKIQVPSTYNNLLKKIKKIIPFKDPRNNQQLKWYQSLKHHFFLYGTVFKGKPIGQCFVYSKNKQDQQSPTIVITKINNYHGFSDQTLIIYSDLSYYYGTIYSKSYQLPRAAGKGILVSKDFIYQGEFQNGYSNGYGSFKTKQLEFTGIFKNGQPAGQGIQRSRSGLFIGQLIPNKHKIGTLITAQNQRQIVTQNSIIRKQIQKDQSERQQTNHYSPHQ